MIALKHVLVPTDFSETSDVALRYGKALARCLRRRRCTCCTSSQEPFAQPWAVEAYGFSLATLQEDWMREATDAPRADAHARGTRDLTAPRSSPCSAIRWWRSSRYAEAHPIDLIVIGTHGRGPLGHMVMGSTAERVVRKAPCPVLTVRHPEREFVVADA